MGKFKEKYYSLGAVTTIHVLPNGSHISPSSPLNSTVVCAVEVWIAKEILKISIITKLVAATYNVERFIISLVKLMVNPTIIYIYINIQI
jgi:hypothetical protein